MKTIHKIALARMGYKTIRTGRKLLGNGSDRITVRRGGIVWDLDLSEVIEFCVFLFGAFEAKTIRLYKQLVKPGDIVIDVGANIGSHALPMARLVGDDGKVVALEPSVAAMEKLMRNIALNPQLAHRIKTFQTLVVAPGTTKVESKVYSSWPFESSETLHEKHRGRLMSTAGAEGRTLDDIVTSLALSKVDLIKIDVEGHEYRVLQGALGTIRKFRPKIVIELAPSIYETNPQEFEGIFEVLREFRPQMLDVNTGAPLPFDAKAMRTAIPDGVSRNALLRI